MERMPQPGDVYRHFKGNLYRVVTLAEHTESGEQLVIYQALYGAFKVYARPLSLFLSKVDHDKYPDVQAACRFTLVPPAGGILAGSQAAEASMADGGGEQDLSLAAEQAAIQEPVTAPGPAGRNPGSAREAAVQESGSVPEKAASEEDFELDPGLLAFLEADSYEKKLEIYASMAGKADESMLNTIAVSLDLELSGDSLEEQYETLKNCLLMLEKYECNRLR